MRTGLKRVLHDLLQKDDISLESGIVNDLIYRMALVEIPGREEENHSFPGLQLTSSRWNKSETLEFSLPELSMQQLRTLLLFLKVPEEKYRTNSPITLDEDFVFNDLLPAFTAYYHQLKFEHSPLITKYQVKSKPILESTAINTLEEYIQKALETLLADNTSEATATTTAISDGLLLLGAKVEKLRQFPALYKSIIESASQIVRLQEMNQNEQLVKPLALILEGIALFKRYNRFESVLAIKSFKKEMEVFLNDGYQISSQSCDVIEESLLTIVGASLGKQGKCKFDNGSDESRMVFHFTDMDKENAAKVVRYFQNMGDETATEGYGYSHYGSVIPESVHASAMAMDSSSYKSTGTRDYLEQHSIEVDGKFFYEKVFPELKKQIALTDPDSLNKYRDLSKACLAAINAEKEKIKPNRNALFQPEKEVGAESQTNALEFTVQ